MATAPRIPFPRNALVSYHYWRNRDSSALADLTLIADSGALSADTQGAVITVNDLCAWATEWREQFGAAATVLALRHRVGVQVGRASAPFAHP